jgi:hypothetical protein
MERIKGRKGGRRPVKREGEMSCTRQWQTMREKSLK